jgi:hypothetical protein
MDKIVIRIKLSKKKLCLFKKMWDFFFFGFWFVNWFFMLFQMYWFSIKINFKNNCIFKEEESFHVMPIKNKIIIIKKKN